MNKKIIFLIVLTVLIISTFKTSTLENFYEQTIITVSNNFIKSNLNLLLIDIGLFIIKGAKEYEDS